MRTFTVMVDGDPPGTARYVLGQAGPGHLLTVAPGPEGRLEAIEIEACRIGAIYRDPYEAAWWQTLTAAPPAPHAGDHEH